MKTIFKLAIGTAAAVGAAGAAQAQVAGIATANPTIAIARSKAFTAASQQIATTYKPSMDQVDAKEKTRQGLIVQLDTNKDGQVSEDEVQKAQASKAPAIAQIQTLDREINGLTEPALKAQGFAIEAITQKYNDAMNKVIADRKIQIILTPESFIYAPDAVDVTPAITAELDRVLPSVSTTVPAGWNPTRQTVGLQQQIQQLAARAAQARAGAPATPAKPAPQGR